MFLLLLVLNFLLSEVPSKRNIAIETAVITVKYTKLTSGIKPDTKNSNTRIAASEAKAPKKRESKTAAPA